MYSRSSGFIEFRVMDLHNKKVVMLYVVAHKDFKAYKL